MSITHDYSPVIFILGLTLHTALLTEDTQRTSYYSFQIFFLVNLTLLIYYPSNYCFECSYFHYFNEIYVFSEVILN